MDALETILIIGYIYRLTCDDPNLVYYGSTIQELWKRFSVHKSNFKHNRVCCASKKLFEVGSVEIELVLEVEVGSIRELREIEQTYIDNDECVNKQRAFQTQEQLKEQKIKASIKYYNSEKAKEYEKKRKNTEYYKEYEKEYNKKYYQSKKIKNIN